MDTDPTPIPTAGQLMIGTAMCVYDCSINLKPEAQIPERRQYPMSFNQLALLKEYLGVNIKQRLHLLFQFTSKIGPVLSCFPWIVSITIWHFRPWLGNFSFCAISVSIKLAVAPESIKVESSTFCLESKITITWELPRIW